jgi:hypothetical protein
MAVDMYRFNFSNVADFFTLQVTPTNFASDEDAINFGEALRTAISDNMVHDFPVDVSIMKAFSDDITPTP